MSLKTCPSASSASSGDQGPPQLIQQLQLDLGPHLADFVASTFPLPPSPTVTVLPASHVPPRILTPLLLHDNAVQSQVSEPSAVDDSADDRPTAGPGIPSTARPHAQVRAAMDQAGLAALDALERHVSLTAGDLTLLKRLNVVAKDQVFHSLVHMQDAVAQWNHARSLEDLLHSRLAALDVLVSRADRLLARATLLERVVNQAARDVAAAAGDGVTVDDVFKVGGGSAKEDKRRSRFAIPSWFSTSAGGVVAAASASGSAGGADDSVAGATVEGGEQEMERVGLGGGGGRQRQM